jgi:hypothetical protein
LARGRIDLQKIRRNWEDILRVVASIYTGTVRAYDVVTMLQRDGHPTALGEAIASYCRNHRYERGLENQLGALGLVLNCVVLWTTVYLDAAVRQLKAHGYPVREEDMARLSPFVSTHLGVHGTYSFVLPDLAPGDIRDLRNPDAAVPLASPATAPARTAPGRPGPLPERHHRPRPARAGWTTA